MKLLTMSKPHPHAMPAALWAHLTKKLNHIMPESFARHAATFLQRYKLIDWK